MLITLWGSFFTDVSNHIEGYTNKADLDKDYADFLEDLHDWLPENCAAVTDAIGHLVREGSIEILESISGKVLEVIGTLMNYILPDCVLEFLENRLVQGIMKVTGAVTQVIAGGALCATVAGAVAGVPMIILGLNQGIVGVQDIYHALKGDLDQPSKDYLKEITGHKIDNTLDLLTLISDTAAGMKATSMLKAAKAARAAKAGGRLSSEMSKLREELSKAKAGSKIAKSLERKAARLVRKESRFVRMKNAVGRRIRAWRPEKPKPETRVRPAVRSVGEIQKDVAAIQRDIAKAGGPQKYLKQQGAPVTELPKGVHPQDPTVPRMAAKLEKAGVNRIDRLIPGKEGCVTGGSSTNLGKNMLREMGQDSVTKWTGYQAQHVIPAELADHPVIKKMGMDLDHASNGIFLRTPGEDICALSRHRGYHSVYNDFVRSQLDAISLKQSVGDIERQVYRLQCNLKKLQASGLPLYPSQGATLELWQRAMANIK